jgi:hypothetical protein
MLWWMPMLKLVTRSANGLSLAQLEATTKFPKFSDKYSEHHKGTTYDSLISAHAC